MKSEIHDFQNITNLKGCMKTLHLHLLKLLAANNALSFNVIYMN